MAVITPSICISLAPPVELASEPTSPFPSLQVTASDQDSFRPLLLTPPPTSLKFKRPLSPLNDTVPSGQGIAQDRFQALLKSTARASLRKEIALKTHKTKQIERRALFLAKILAPPSPSATSTPKTPPESPAIFHYSLPSPGLESPLAVFESLMMNEDPAKGPISRHSWVEQVDFRIRAKTSVPKISVDRASRPLPSLDQITARMTFASRPAPVAPVVAARPQLPIGTLGRLRMPIRAAKPAPLDLAPLSPSVALIPDIQVTTLVVPSSATTSSPTELSQTNLNALDIASRSRQAQDMLLTLKRRTTPDVSRAERSKGLEKLLKRRSAPAELMKRGPSEFDHPILAFSGAF